MQEEVWGVAAQLIGLGLGVLLLVSPEIVPQSGTSISIRILAKLSMLNYSTMQFPVTYNALISCQYRAHRALPLRTGNW